MPAAITHYCLAQRVRKDLRLENLDRDAFLWGAQGPDFFFCHRYLPWQKGVSLLEYGNRLHREQPSVLLGAMREYYSAHQNPLILSYLYGFLTHYAADRNCHPYVRWHAKKLLDLDEKQTETLCHIFLESQLDVIILRYETAELTLEFPLTRTVPKNDFVQQDIAELYTCLLEKLYGKRFQEALLRQAVDDMREGFRALSDRTGAKRFLMRQWENAHGGKHVYSCHFRGMMEEGDYDYANALMEQWESGGEPSRNTFFDLYEESVKDAARMIDGFLTTTDYGELTQEIPFG